LESFVNNDSQIPQPHLLPIRWWTEKINPKGGTSSIYKVSIPSSAIQQWAVNTATNQNLSLDFAVKQYSSQHYDSFERELKAFTYLDGTDGVLKCFGSFTLLDSQGGKIYNLLLELADSDLADYWARTPRPRKGEIRLYWRSLVPVINALQHIHTLKPRLDNPYHLYGWHGDIKPDNILMVKGEFKLADFGFSKFTEPDGRAVADIEQTLDGGTHVYGTYVFFSNPS
jgi:serine/threonine protein kinase